jgi:hypothetical protein
MSVQMAMGKMSSCVEIKTTRRGHQDDKTTRSYPHDHITIHPSFAFVRVLRETRADS